MFTSTASPKGLAFLSKCMSKKMSGFAVQGQSDKSEKPFLLHQIIQKPMCNIKCVCVCVSPRLLHRPPLHIVISPLSRFHPLFQRGCGVVRVVICGCPAGEKFYTHTYTQPHTHTNTHINTCNTHINTLSH